MYSVYFSYISNNCRKIHKIPIRICFTWLDLLKATLKSWSDNVSFSYKKSNQIHPNLNWIFKNVYNII